MKHVKTVKNALNVFSSYLETMSSLYLVTSKIIANSELQDRIALAASNIAEEVTDCISALSENKEIMQHVEKLEKIAEKWEEKSNEMFNIKPEEEEIMQNENKVKIKWMSLITTVSDKYSLDVLSSMDVIELRDLYEELRPTYICQTSVTAGGGVRRSAVKLERKAA